MAASDRNKRASVFGLAFPPGLVLPDPSEGTFPSTPELEQLGFSYALDVTAAGAATQIAINAGDNQSATVATTLPVNPSVIVRDAGNLPVAGVAVTFAVASGAGTITGAVATTNASGIATVGSWTLGALAGANTLTATSAGLAGSPVTISATATAAVATATTPRTNGLLWSLPSGSGKRAFARGAARLPMPTTRIRCRVAVPALTVSGQARGPVPVSAGRAASQDSVAVGEEEAILVGLMKQMLNEVGPGVADEEPVLLAMASLLA